ncbi:unnamed protein product, partial [Polarella glacialis]
DIAIVVARAGDVFTVKCEDGTTRAVKDSELKQVFPWMDVEAVLSSEEASQLRSKTGAELLDASFAKKVAVAMANDQEVQHDAQALFVLGPSAAGKSHALRNGSVEVPRGALTLDGGFIRSVSTSWSKALDIAKSKRLGGLTNYFKDYFKAPMDKVKNQAADEAIRSRANVVIPDTASDFKATTAMVSKLLAAGYSLRFMAVFADKEVCESR